MPTRLRQILVTLCFLGSHCVGDASHAADDLRPQVDPFAQPYIDGEVCVGLSIGIWKEGSSRSWGYGKTSLPNGMPPNGQTIYEIGSISKVFTGILLGDAAVSAQVRLDQPLQELLPKDIVVSTTGEVPIQLIHLATHTSGLPRLPTNLKFTDPGDPYADYDEKSLFEFLKGYSPERSVLTKMEYSNLGVGLLGHLLARRAGVSYGQLLKDRLTNPLNMKDTNTTLSPEQNIRLAAPYSNGGVVANNWHLGVLEGAGGILSTTDDMLCLIAAMAKPPENALGKAIDMSWHVQQNPITEGDFAMGLCWHIARDGQTRWHNGETGGYHSMVLVNREQQLGVVVLANTADGGVDTLAEDLMRMLAGSKVSPRDFKKPAKVDAQVVQRYVGTFEIVPGFALEIVADENRLTVQATNQPAFRLFPRTDTEWFLRVVEATITFRVDEAGVCNELDLFQGGVHNTAKRIPKR